MITVVAEYRPMSKSMLEMTKTTQPRALPYVDKTYLAI